MEKNIFKKSIPEIFEEIKKNKKAKIIAIIVTAFAALLLVFGIWGCVCAWKKSFKIGNGPYVKDREHSKYAPRRLDGVMVEKDKVNKFPFAIMIENVPEARPQKGLSKASVIYETFAEGGITRFMAVFSGEKVEEIWPVRSARHYYLEWSSEYNALYVHCGGSPQAYEMISDFKIPVLNELSVDAKYFWRGPEGMPHNLYTSSNLLEKAIADKNYEKRMVPKYESWKFKNEKKKEDRPNDEHYVRVGFAGPYNPEFKYDRESNSYLRYTSGLEHQDRLTGKQLSAKNVVVQMVLPETYFGDDKGRIDISVTGEGKAYVFRDGEAIEGTWKKKERVARTKFFDKNNKEIQLNRGQTWVVVVPGERSVEYK